MDKPGAADFIQLAKRFTWFFIFFGWKKKKKKKNATRAKHRKKIFKMILNLVGSLQYVQDFLTSLKKRGLHKYVLII